VDSTVVREENRRRYRSLQQRGYVRCTTYWENLCRMHALPFCEGPESPVEGADICSWVPAWLVWYVGEVREKGGTQRERIEEAKALVNDLERQYVLLAELSIYGNVAGVLHDMDADLSVQGGMKELEKVLGKQ